MASQKRPMWMGQPTLAVKAAKFVALAVIVAIVVVPFWVVVATSLTGSEELSANGGYALWPAHPTFEAYQQVFTGGIVTKALLVSAGITLIGTAVSLTANVLLAYALSRPGVYGGKPLMLLILFTFLVPPGIIPAYLVVKELGLLQNYASLILPVMLSAFNVVIMRGFFQGVPEDLFAAARIDGAGEMRILTRIVLPLSKAVVAVVGLFYAVAYWNAFFYASLYINDSTRWPVQQVVRLYVLQGAQMGENASAETGQFIAPQSIQMAAVVIAVIPIVCVYPFLQRYFVKGVLTGAIKS